MTTKVDPRTVRVKSLILGQKIVFKHQDLQKINLKLNKMLLTFNTLYFECIPSSSQRLTYAARSESHSIIFKEIENVQVHPIYGASKSYDR